MRSGSKHLFEKIIHYININRAIKKRIYRFSILSEVLINKYHFLCVLIKKVLSEDSFFIKKTF